MLKRHYGHSSARHIAGLWLVNSRVKMGSWSDPSPIQYIHVYRYRYLHIPKYVYIYIQYIHIYPRILYRKSAHPHVDHATTGPTGGITCDSTHLSWPSLHHLWSLSQYQPSFFFWAIIHHIRWGRLGWLLGLSQSLQEWAPEIISWFTHPPNCQHMQIYHSTSVIKPSWPSYKPTCLSGDHFRCRAFHLEVCHSHGLIEGLGKAVPPIEVITPQS